MDALLLKSLYAGNPTHDKTSFSSQSTYILPYPASTTASEDYTTRYVYVADRFEPYLKNNEAARYVWLPIDVDTSSGNLSVAWQDEWTP